MPEPGDYKLVFLSGDDEPVAADDCKFEPEPPALYRFLSKDGETLKEVFLHSLREPPKREMRQTAAEIARAHAEWNAAADSHNALYGSQRLDDF